VDARWTAHAATTAGSAADWWGENDDRWRIDPRRGFAYVADASGPTYAGYHAPFAVDAALGSFARVFDDTRGPPAERLRTAIIAAHAHARELSDTHRIALARASRDNANDDEVALRVSALLCPPVFERIRGATRAHFTFSLTAIAIEGETLALVQVGSSRCYRLRDGELTLLASDHTLATALADQGDDPTEASRLHGNVVVSVLGAAPDPRIETVITAVRAGDRFLLCSDGLWRVDGGDAAVSEAFAATKRETLAAITARCADLSHDDATAVLAIRA
jgi:hypothetical protein